MVVVVFVLFGGDSCCFAVVVVNFILFCFKTISYSPGKPQTCGVAEDDLESVYKCYKGYKCAPPSCIHVVLASFMPGKHATN